MFLPWHRYYLQYFENALIRKCDYKGATPYWDWTLGNVTPLAGIGSPGVVAQLIGTTFTQTRKTC